MNATLDLRTLLHLGRRLDERPFRLSGESWRERIIGRLLRVRDKRGRLVPLRANRMQREFSRRAGARNIVLKARQMGLTTWAAARYFAATITRPGTTTVLVAQDQRSAEEMFRIVHRFWENLPGRLRRGALLRSRSNLRQIRFARLDSDCRAESAADTDVGRGLTIQQLHASEVARWPGDAAATLAALRAAVPPDGEVILESTPDGAAGCFYEEWQRAGESGYLRHFYPWWWEESYRSLDLQSLALTPKTQEELALQDRHRLSDAQLAFRRRIQAEFRRLAPQEFAEDPESCFLASGDCVFDAEAVHVRLREAEREYGHQLRPGLTVFFPPVPGNRYVIGVDPASGGTAGDYSCAQVMDRATGLQCAELHGHLDPPALAAQVAALAKKFRDALVAVERNGLGQAVLAYLHTSHPGTQLYTEKGIAGAVTDLATRPHMIALLDATLASQPSLFRSPRLLREMRTFIRHANGRQEAAAGAHDDCLLAFGIALRVRELTAAGVKRVH